MVRTCGLPMQITVAVAAVCLYLLLRPKERDRLNLGLSELYSHITELVQLKDLVGGLHLVCARCVCCMQ